MNNYLVKKSVLKGEIIVPPSKSQTLRAILFASLGKGKSTIYHYLQSTDTKAMLQALKLLGATINIFSDRLEIIGLNGKINGADDVINAGNSGIVLRFCSGLAALSKKPIVITGDHSIRHLRSMEPLLKSLKSLGVNAISTKDDGFAPVIIYGPIMSKKTTIQGEDSQGVSALIIASSFIEGPIEISVENPGEKPWVSLTLSWLERLKIPYANHDFEKYQILGPATYEGFEYIVPGDLSSLSFPIAAALITNSEITIKNVDMNDPQGDKELIFVFQKMGALIEIEENEKIIRVKKGGVLSGITVDINNFIDALTILAVVACYANGETRIYNASIARGKECNRLHAITTELKKMGANIEETEDGLIIKKSELKGAKLYSYQDHRMCMSLAVAGLGAIGETEISDIACVNKTFPSFLKDFQALSAEFSEIQFKGNSSHGG